MSKIQVLPNRRTPYGMLYSGLGQGIGAGIESGMEDYARRNAEEEQFQRGRIGLEAFTNDPEMAKRLALLPPALQLQAIKGFQGQQKLQQQQQQVLEKQKLEQQENLKKEIFEMQKFHKKELDAIAEDARKAEEEEKILDQIDEILASGKYQGVKDQNILEKYGLKTQWLNAETQLVQKLMQKLVFASQLEEGGQLTDAKLKAYEKANLSLLNTPEGAKLISDSMRLAINKRKSIGKSRSKFVKKYEGKVLPHTLDEIYEQARHDEEKYARKEENIEKKYAHYIKKHLKENPPINENEGIGGFIGRNIARSGARAGEALLGLPGDVLGGINSAVEYGLGIKTPYSRFQEHTGFAPIPTSENIRENVTKKLTGERLEPQGAEERFADEVVKDLTTLMAPGKIASKGIKGISKFASYFAGPEFGLGKQAARAAGSNLAKLLAEEVTGSELAGGVAKLGTIALTSLPNFKEALGKRAEELYAKKDAILAKEKPYVQPKEVSEEMNKLAKWTQSGLGEDVEAKDQIFKSIKKLDNQIKNQGISVQDLLEARADIREKLRMDEFTGKAIPKAIELEKTINNEIQKYGSKNKPFIDALNEADALYAGKMANSAINDYANQLLDPKKITSNIGKILLFGGAGVAAAPKAVLGALAGFGIAKGVGKSHEYIKMIKSNAPVRKYLKQVAQAALKQDKGGFITGAKNLDRLLKRQEERD